VKRRRRIEIIAFRRVITVAHWAQSAGSNGPPPQASQQPRTKAADAAQLEELEIVPEPFISAEAVTSMARSLLSSEVAAEREGRSGRQAVWRGLRQSGVFVRRSSCWFYVTCLGIIRNVRRH
jgi:hypothetical protein